MNLFEEKIRRIKNNKAKLFSKDFSYGAFSFLVLGLFLAGGFAWQMAAAPPAEILDLVKVSVGILVGGIIIGLIPMWATVMQMIILLWIGIAAALDLSYVPMAVTGSLGLLFSASFELVYQWDKVVILRMGRFKKVHGPGLFMLLPLLDRTAAFVDTRIRATDFSAEKTLTRDTVPVHVDALCFWMIWDAKQAVLEVENYLEAVTLSAQTALRDSIGRHTLGTLLSEREKLAREIQESLDKKTSPWGVTILSIEFTDIVIPRELEDAMSKQAQAEREKQSRVILAEAEKEIAAQFQEASRRYDENPTALQLRAMNMVYEGIRQNKSSLMLMPSAALDQMNLGSALGTAALGKDFLANTAPPEQKKTGSPSDHKNAEGKEVKND